jgi:transcriptional regulator with XRE-family HTH domain
MSTQLISERIKKARENLGITMAEASRRLNLSKIGYCRYEYGERTPSSQTLDVIARCFNTSVDYLTGKTDDMSPDKIVISKENEPELFGLIESCRNSEPDTINRLLEYYQKIIS